MRSLVINVSHDDVGVQGETWYIKWSIGEGALQPVNIYLRFHIEVVLRKRLLVTFSMEQTLEMTRWDSQ